VNALKGQWLGAGYVYVSDHPDRSQLVVSQPSQPVRTLFAAGSVWSYSLGAGGRQIAAIASEQLEPMGLWVADPTSGKISRVLAQENYSPRVDRCAVTNASGQRVEYTVFRPADLHPAKPYPVVFVSAIGRSWAELSQVLPRLNMVQVMPGVGWTTLEEKATEPQNLSAIWREVAKSYPVDTNRVYLQGMSKATASLASLVEGNSQLFRGLIIDSPGSVGGLPDPDLLRRNNLEVMLTIGTEDELHAATKQYAAALRRRGVPVWLEEIAGMGHGDRNSDHREQRVRATVSFIHRSARPESK
jgi:acetyl esterase/lipase